MALSAAGMVRMENKTDPLHREATLSRLESLVIARDKQNPVFMRDLGQKIVSKVGSEWEWWKPGSRIR